MPGVSCRRAPGRCVRSRLTDPRNRIAPVRRLGRAIFPMPVMHRSDVTRRAASPQTTMPACTRVYAMAAFAREPDHPGRVRTRECAV
jgi:hypothetical protein